MEDSGAGKGLAVANEAKHFQGRREKKTKEEGARETKETSFKVAPTR